MTILETYFSLKNTSPFVHNSGVARGGWGARAPLDLADQSTLFEPGWADFAPHSTASPQEFRKLSTPLHNML